MVIASGTRNAGTTLTELSGYDFLKSAKKFSWIVLAFSIVFQLIFFPDLTNIAAMAVVVVTWGITTRIWLQHDMLHRYLLSTFMILGFSLSQFYLPLVFTTIENRPLIYNLVLPEEVFLHAFLCLTVLIISHAAYRAMMRAVPGGRVSVLEKLGFFEPPSQLQLWLIGIIGLACGVYVHFTSPEIGREVTGDPMGKFMQALIPFMYAPFFIPIAKLFGNYARPHRGYIPAIICFTILMFGIGLARNSRSIFVFGFTTPAFAYIVGLLLGVFKTKIITFRNVAAALVVGWILTGPLSDLGIAMVNVRLSQPDLKELSPAQLISLTFEALQDETAIEARKKEQREVGLEDTFDDRYLENIFTARFANIKYNDLNLQHYENLGKYDPDMQQYSLDHVIAYLPDPVIKFFGFDLDKETILLFSFGDTLYVLSGGPGTPAGLRVGHIAGTGMATFGWWYLLLFGTLIIPVFYLNDKFFRRRKPSQLTDDAAPGHDFKFSFCGALALTLFFQFLISESVVNFAEYLIRGWPQLVGTYLVVFFITRKMASLLKGRRRRPSVPWLSSPVNTN